MNNEAENERALDIAETLANKSDFIFNNAIAKRH